MSPTEDPAGREEHRPSSVTVTETGTWVAWTSYRKDQERLLVRFVGAAETPGPTEVIAASGRHAAPQIVLGGDSPMVIWLRGRSGAGAEVVTSRRSSRGWSEPAALSVGDGTVLSLALTRSSPVSGSAGKPKSTENPTGAEKAGLWAVWCQAEAPGTYAVLAARCDGQRWSAPLRVTAPGTRPHRPDVALACGGCWVVWDEYQDGIYAVLVAFITDDGALLPSERVSPVPLVPLVPNTASMVTPAAWQFAPSITVDHAGSPWASWLVLQDMQREDGVIDQWATARAAHRSAGAWHPVTDASQRPDLAQLSWSLASYHGSGVWGFLGRRRRPLVVADPEDGAWLLWERKEHHGGKTPTSRGILHARRLRPNAPATSTQIVAVGPRAYVPATIQRDRSERRLWLTARAGPDVSSTAVTSVIATSYSLDATQPLDSSGDWSDWSPVLIDEPAFGLSALRPTVQSDGAALQLYWADLHVHTELSADAEGHPDEIISYARDKAQLDCIAISDNDFSQLSLTASDWDLSGHYTHHFNEPGRFIMLPAYEWTYRPTERSAPDHRTVLGVRDNFPILRCHEAGADPVSALHAHAAQHDLLLHVHHERWELHGPSPVPEVNWEIASGWGSHMANPSHRARYEAAIAAGHRLGFVANSDNHRRNPGLGGALTGIWASELTREALLEALCARRTIATDGNRVAARLWVNDTFVGGETTSDHPPRVRWHVSGAALPSTITLMRNASSLHTWTIEQHDARGDYVDQECPAGPHAYYLAIEHTADTGWHECPANVAVARGPHAWTSPVWITLKGMKR